MKGKTIKPSQPHNGTTPTEPAQPVEPSEPAQPGPPTSEPLQGTYCQNLQYRFPDQISTLILRPSPAEVEST